MTDTCTDCGRVKHVEVCEHLVHVGGTFRSCTRMICDDCHHEGMCSHHKNPERGIANRLARLD